ncbi:MAG: porin [Candidatus Acidiferrales bacterium]
MKRTRNNMSRPTIAMLALGLAVVLAPVSRAEDQPSGNAAAQPALAAQPATSQPAAAAQPATDDQRLQELEKEVMLLQQEIASLKADSTPGMKTAALTQPESNPGSFNPSSPADDAPAKVSLAGLLGPVTLSGFGDVYYGYDYNHPGNNEAGLRSFEYPTNGFNFNMAELILDKAPDATTSESRLGYHISAGYGTAAEVVNCTDYPFSDCSNFYLKEAYLSYLAPIGKGLTITVGKFVTPMGAEVIESNANWNYTRGLLFDYAIPLFHFGANAKYAFNSKWALTGYLVNGWNNTNIAHYASGGSSGLTYGGSLAFTPTAKWSVTENYFAGPVIDFYPTESDNLTVNDWKQISDTVIGYTPNTKWAFQLNGDYGFGPRSYTYGACSTGTTGGAIVRPEATVAYCPTSPTKTWWGAAGYAKYTLSPKTNFAARYEYYEDPNGYTGLLFGEHGQAQEVTGTYSYNLTSALLVRGEYRYDFAGVPIFATGHDSRLVKEQNTAYISFVYSFSSANLK